MIRKLSLLMSLLILGCSNSFAATVTFAWDHHPDPVVVGYNLYRSTTSGGPYTKVNLMLIPQPATVTDTPMYTDTTPSNTQVFYYVVRAVSSGNIESANSNEVIVNPPPTPPTNLRIVSFSISNLLIDGVKVASGVPPISYTIPRQAPPRSYQVQVTAQ